MGKKHRKNKSALSSENILSKEEAILIAKTYVHSPIITTPQTVNDKDIIGKYLQSVTKLIQD